MRTQSAGPSATARLIAACTLYLAHDPRFDAFVPPGAATLSKELLLASGFRGRLICLAVRHTLLLRVGAIIESRMLPGVSMHYALRKRWLEDRVREAIGRGATQLLILGAGYDSLGHRLAQEMRELQVLVEQISTHSVYGGSFRTDAVDDPAIAEGEQLYYARSTGRRH